MAETLPKTNMYVMSDNNNVDVSAQRLLFIGQMNGGGTATSGALVQEIGISNEWDTLFGVKSHLAGMIRSARKLCQMANINVSIDAIPLADHASGVASAGSIALSGTATTAGSLYFSIASENDYKFKVDVSVGDTAVQVATALKALIDANTQIPVSNTLATSTLTLTASNKGTVGNSIPLKVDGNIAGITITLTAFTNGATDPTMPTLASIIGDIRYQGVVHPVEYGVTYASAVLQPRFNVNNKILDGVAYVTKTDTLANLNTLISAINHASLVCIGNKSVNVASFKGGSIVELNHIISAQIATIAALKVTNEANLSSFVIGDTSRDKMGGIHNNSLPFFNTSMPLISIINQAYHFTGLEIASLKTAGGSTINNNLANNGVVIGELVTTYKTDIAGNADETFTNLEYVKTSSAIREYCFLNFKKDYSQSRMKNTILDEIKSSFISWFGDLKDLDLMRDDLDYYIENFKISANFLKGSINLECKNPIVTQLRTLNAFLKISFPIIAS